VGDQPPGEMVPWQRPTRVQQSSSIAPASSPAVSLLTQPQAIASDPSLACRGHAVLCARRCGSTPTSHQVEASSWAAGTPPPEGWPGACRLQLWTGRRAPRWRGRSPASPTRSRSAARSSAGPTRAPSACCATTLSPRPRAPSRAAAWSWTLPRAGCGRAAGSAPSLASARARSVVCSSPSRLQGTVELPDSSTGQSDLVFHGRHERSRDECMDVIALFDEATGAWQFEVVDSVVKTLKATHRRAPARAAAPAPIHSTMGSPPTRHCVRQAAAGGARGRGERRGGRGGRGVQPERRRARGDAGAGRPLRWACAAHPVGRSATRGRGSGRAAGLGAGAPGRGAGAAQSTAGAALCQAVPGRAWAAPGRSLGLPQAAAPLRSPAPPTRPWRRARSTPRSPTTRWRARWKPTWRAGTPTAPTRLRHPPPSPAPRPAPRLRRRPPRRPPPSRERPRTRCARRACWASGECSSPGSGAVTASWGRAGAGRAGAGGGAGRGPADRAGARVLCERGRVVVLVVQLVLLVLLRRRGPQPLLRRRLQRGRGPLLMACMRGGGVCALRRPCLLAQHSQGAVQPLSVLRDFLPSSSVLVALQVAWAVVD